MAVDGGRYSVILSEEARRAVREIEVDDAELLADALRTLLDEPPGEGAVFPLPAQVSTYLRTSPAPTDYFVLVTASLHNAIFRTLTDDERRQQSTLLGIDLLNPTYFVVDVVPA